MTYYGAVGAGCSASELAYQFLRLFLTEKAQWQECTDLIAEDIGWPVYSVEDDHFLFDVYCDYYQERYKSGYPYPPWKVDLHSIGALDASIDRAVFEADHHRSFRDEVVNELNMMGTGSAKDVDIVVLAQNWTGNLEKMTEE